MDEQRRTEIALWRVGVLGPLVSAKLEHGDLRRLCEEAAGRTYCMPDGRHIALKGRTIEGWHYAYKKYGIEGLKPKGRSDGGRSRAIPKDIAERLVALKRENPRRSIRRLIRMLERAGEVGRGRLKRSTVHRLLVAHGVSKQPKRVEETERRAFRHPYAGDCWMGDVLHGPKIKDDKGRPHKTYLHAFVDSATRLVPHCAFRLSERADDFEAVLKEAIRRHGVPRVLYLDNGAAQTAESLRRICADLSIHLRHCRPYDAAAKGGVERFFRTYRAEVLDELGEGPHNAGDLCAFTWAWLSTEYHRRKHEGTGRVPVEHWLEQVERLRPAPNDETLDRIFMHRQVRRVRRDSTVRYRGHFLEVRAELCGQLVELRFLPGVAFDPNASVTWPDVYVDGRFVCDTYPLDRLANSVRSRHRLSRAVTPPAEPTGLDPLAQMADEQARLVRRPSHANAHRHVEE